MTATFVAAVGLVGALALGVPAEAQTPPGQPTPAADPHAGHHPPEETAPPVPPVTDADRQAAFPDVAHGHTVHDDVVHWFALADQLEWQHGRGVDSLSWDVKGWIGKDRERLHFRSEGDGAGGMLEEAQAHLLYGRAISPWWTLTAGLRQDLVPDTPRTALALGIQGLAPYWFEIEASAYVETSGRSHVRVEIEHDLLLTNRLRLQPLAEFEIYARADPERGLGAGLSTGHLGLRLRYEVRREVAPYIGVVWHRTFFDTADYARRRGDRPSGPRLAIGVRLWR